MAMGDLGDSLEIGDIAGRITDALAIDRAGASSMSGSTSFARSLAAKRDRHALVAENMGEKRVGRAVKLMHRDDVVAALNEVCERVVDRRRARADAERLHAALERCDSRSSTALVGIADPRIDVAGDFEVESAAP